MSQLQPGCRLRGSIGRLPEGCLNTYVGHPSSSGFEGLRFGLSEVQTEVLIVRTLVARAQSARFASTEIHGEPLCNTVRIALPLRALPTLLSVLRHHLRMGCEHDVCIKNRIPRCEQRARACKRCGRGGSGQQALNSCIGMGAAASIIWHPTRLKIHYSTVSCVRAFLLLAVLRGTPHLVLKTLSVVCRLRRWCCAREARMAASRFCAACMDASSAR